MMLQEASVSGLEGPFMISGRETELESSDSLRLAELERGSMVSKENQTCLRQGQAHDFL